MEFEWDGEKERANVEKHGVGFAEASTVFGDPFEITIPDPLSFGRRVPVLERRRVVGGSGPGGVVRGANRPPHSDHQRASSVEKRTEAV